MSAGARSRAPGGLAGTWIGLGTYVGLTVLVLATAPDYPDYR